MDISYPWYEESAYHNGLLLGFLAYDIIITVLGYPSFPYLAIPAILVLVFSIPLGFQIWGKLRSLMRYRLGKVMSQRCATYLGLGIALLSIPFHVWTIGKYELLLGFFIAPLLQGLGLSLGRAGPSYLSALFAEYERKELVEKLDAIAGRYKIDTRSQNAITNLDKIVSESDVVDWLTKEEYRRHKPWVWEDLRKRWREEELHGVTDIFSVWRDIVHLRGVLRKELRRRTGFGFIHERESLFVEMAHLPDSRTELMDLIIKLKEYIDDFDSHALKNVTGKSSNIGSKSLNSLLKHLDISPPGEPVVIWRSLRNVRHGLAHPDPSGHSEKFASALRSLGLAPDSLLYEPKSSWLRISQQYRESLRSLVKAFGLDEFQENGNTQFE